ncbi:MAG TPA: GNAT family N-acetyltransferase, partial [Chthoniobacterales bacterium]|nr:GNAT family N-acetyltransferase [Chthoniobacterales bacterium]
MSGQIKTRAFQIADYDAAMRLWDQVEGIEIAEGDSRDEIARFLARNPGLSRVAEDNDIIIGVSLCGHDGRRGYIYHLAVAPDYHARGVGRKLVAECLTGLLKAGVPRALILVAGDNPRGQAFWRRCGWEEVSDVNVMGIDPG